MRVAGSIYMVWLALKIPLAKPIGEMGPGGRPISFLDAVGFQWVNPKAWVMALSALATYGGVADGYTSRVLFIAALCAVMTVPCGGVWMVFGASLRRLLMDPRVIRPFNWTMAALLVASIAPTLFE
jgi:threonine/homoserine/homoserine lactone efflux protein